MLNPGTLVDEKFEIVSLLGQGAMGIVYKARHIQLDRYVALKILHPEQRSEEVSARFEREATILSELRHRNIVTFYGYGFHDTSRYIAMELLAGESLESCLQHGPLELATGVDIMLQITDGIACAHGQGILHRDLKPTNIIVQGNQTEHEAILAKVVDFGLARIELPDAPSTLDLTGAQSVASSILYSSPEQCAGKDIDERSDVYSLGCIMHHCLSGMPPFGGLHTVLIRQQHLKEAPTMLDRQQDFAHVPVPVLDVVCKALAKDPHDRYQSARELHDDLLKLRTGNPEKITAGGMSSLKRGRRIMASTIAIYTSLVVGTALLLYEYWQSTRSATPVVTRERNTTNRDEHGNPIAATDVAATKILPAASGPSEPKRMWRFYLRHGAQAVKLNYPDKALECYSRALSLMDKHSRPDDVLDVKLGLAESYNMLRRYQEGWVYAQDAMKSFPQRPPIKEQQTGDPDDPYLRALKVNGGIARGLAKYDLAQKYYLEHLAYAKLCGNRWDEAYTYQSLGETLMSANDYKGADEYFSKGINLSRERNSPVNPWSLSGRAFSRRSLGRTREALEDYKASIPAFSAIDPISNAEDSLYQAMLQTARLHTQLGDRSSAKKVYREIITKRVLGSGNLAREVEASKLAAREELEQLEESPVKP